MSIEDLEYEFSQFKSDSERKFDEMKKEISWLKGAQAESIETEDFLTAKFRGHESRIVRIESELDLSAN